VVFRKIRALIRGAMSGGFSTEWQPFYAMRRRHLMGGDYANGYLMSRVVNGEIYYRKMTLTELNEHQRDMAI